MTRQESIHDIDGYTIMEMLAAIAISSMILLLCFNALLSSMRLSAYCTRSIDHDNDARQVQRVFLDAIRNASEVAPSVASYTTGPDTLVLRSQEPNRYIVLGDLTNQGNLQQLEIIDDHGVFQAGRHSVCRLPLTSLHFETANKGRLIRMDISTAPFNPHKPELARNRCFIATVRGATEAAP